jgi:hypothetical protein
LQGEPTVQRQFNYQSIRKTFGQNLSEAVFAHPSLIQRQVDRCRSIGSMEQGSDSSISPYGQAFASNREVQVFKHGSVSPVKLLSSPIGDVPLDWKLSASNQLTISNNYAQNLKNLRSFPLRAKARSLHEVAG